MTGSYNTGHPVLKLFQHWAYKRPTWKRLCTARERHIACRAYTSSCLKPLQEMVRCTPPPCMSRCDFLNHWRRRWELAPRTRHTRTRQATSLLLATAVNEERRRNVSGFKPACAGANVLIGAGTAETAGAECAATPPLTLALRTRLEPVPRMIRLALARCSRPLVLQELVRCTYPPAQVPRSLLELVW